MLSPTSMEGQASQSVKQPLENGAGRISPPAAFARILGASIGPAARLFFHLETLKQFPRLLREGMGPIDRFIIQSTNTAQINRWLDHGTKVAFLASYPRSGNTWMRFMLSDILLQMNRVETSTQLPVHPDDLIPEFRCNSIVNRLSRCPAWAVEPPVAFIKTHLMYERLQATFAQDPRALEPRRNFRAVYLYRSAEDALVSFYHWRARQPGRKCKTPGESSAHTPKFQLNNTGAQNGTALDIDEFCRKAVFDWTAQMESYLRAANDGFPVFFLSYEWLLEKPSEVLHNLFDWLELPHDNRIIERAVSNMNFKNLHAMERQEHESQQPANANEFFFRRGRPGSGRDELKEATVKEIQERTAAVLANANGRQLTQSQERRAAPSAPAGLQRNGDSVLSKASLPLQ